MSENRTPEPERLYHYTNPKGLLGIAQSRVLWASNIRYLGDSSEYLHAVQLALSVVESAEDMTAQEREFFDYLLGKSEVGAWIRARLCSAGGKLESKSRSELELEPDCD